MSIPFSDFEYSTEHPHYTPGWLSSEVASLIPANFKGRVIDPACGAGNLLAAAVLHTNGSRRSADELEFIGADVSKRAVASCGRVLTTLLPNRNFTVECRDFLKATAPRGGKPSAVVMNPPFRGYGELRERLRRRVVRKLRLKGRFNLGYAFVCNAMDIYHPELLISILPSNWIYSSGSTFRDELDIREGKWEWEDVGEKAFKCVSAHVGILVWRSGQKSEPSIKRGSTAEALDMLGIEVRHGVATGRDAAFEDIAALNLRWGQKLNAVKGRDVARATGSELWMAPDLPARELKRKFAKAVPAAIVRKLTSRSCVTSGRRQVFQYHDPVPEWFIGAVKLLVPEVVCGELRVEVDAHGQRFPLHSTIAIRVPSASRARALKSHLEGDRLRLVAQAPRLNGGAVRLQVQAVRESILRWAVSQRLVKLSSNA